MSVALFFLLLIVSLFFGLWLLGFGLVKKPPPKPMVYREDNYSIRHELIEASLSRILREAYPDLPPLFSFELTEETFTLRSVFPSTYEAQEKEIETRLSERIHQFLHEKCGISQSITIALTFE